MTTQPGGKRASSVYAQHVALHFARHVRVLRRDQESLQSHTELGEHLAAGRAATTLAEVEVLAENPVAARGWLDVAAGHLSNSGNPQFEVAWIQNHWTRVALIESATLAGATALDEHPERGALL